MQGTLEAGAQTVVIVGRESAEDEEEEPGE